MNTCIGNLIDAHVFGLPSNWTPHELIAAPFAYGSQSEKNALLKKAQTPAKWHLSLFNDAPPSLPASWWPIIIAHGAVTVSSCPFLFFFFLFLFGSDQASLGQVWQYPFKCIYHLRQFFRLCVPSKSRESPSPASGRFVKAAVLRYTKRSESKSFRRTIEMKFGRDNLFTRWYGT